MAPRDFPFDGKFQIVTVVGGIESVRLEGRHLIPFSEARPVEASESRKKVSPVSIRHS